MNSQPSVAVIIPAYDSFATIERSLDSFCGQTYPVFEIIVVDSSPNDHVEKIVKNKFPGITYIHSQKRLLPHAARNQGGRRTAADLFVFTDPDIYAPADWLEHSVAAYQQYGGVIVGPLTNHTNQWRDWGIHLMKFDLFLPVPEVRPLPFAATANMLCSRRDFELMGGFENDEMLGDLLISWKFSENQIPIVLVPSARVEHHHTQSVFKFMRERYRRGKDFGRLRHDCFHWTRLHTVRHIFLSVSGLRLIGLLVREGRHSLSAGLFIKFLHTFPVSLMGQVSWLLGETAAFIRSFSP